MKIFIVLFIAAGVFKVISLTVKKYYYRESIEINNFYEAESFRKFIEHGNDYSKLEVASIHSKHVPQNGIEKLNKSSEPHSRAEILNRKWCQDYLKIINTRISIHDSISTGNISQFPEILQNTVLEENAKNEIYRISGQHNWFENEYKRREVKGMIKEIKLTENSLFIKMAPFWYLHNLEFDECTQEGQAISIKSNPFYYKGSLQNWICTKLHRGTNEMSEYEIEYQ
jgi:hypothetical protein